MKTKSKHSKSKHVKTSEKKATQRYQRSEQEIEGMIQQLNSMSLHDPKYVLQSNEL